jgi:hypothetical protein
MNQILVYCYSLTWGIIPNARARLPIADQKGNNFVVDGTEPPQCLADC